MHKSQWPGMMREDSTVVGQRTEGKARFTQVQLFHSVPRKLDLHLNTDMVCLHEPCYNLKGKQGLKRILLDSIYYPLSVLS